MAIGETRLKSYTFKVVLERDRWPDEPEEQAVWRAYVPLLRERGAHAWGDTPEEALENLRNAVELLLEYLKEKGEPIPEEPDQVEVSAEPRITVTL